MKVLFVTTHLNIGGIAHYITLLGRALTGEGVKVAVVSSGGECAQTLAESGVKVFTVDFRTKFELHPKVILGARQLSRLVQEEGVDIIHAHTRVTQVAASFASRWTGVPYVTTCHGFFKKRLGRRLFGCWGEKVIAISAPVREALMRDFKVASARIRLIRNGIDVDGFSKTYTQEELLALRKRLGIRPGILAGTIGRLSSVKGHRFFVEAMKAVVSAAPSAQAVLIGDGPEEGDLRALVKSCALEGVFHLVDACPDTAKYLALMDVFVFPSIKEGLGLSLLEAMAAGRPCVASRVGGITDIIRDEECGLLVPVGDSAALASAITRLVRDEALRVRLGEAARRVVRERFSLSTMVAQIVKLYDEVAAERLDAAKPSSRGPRRA